VVHFKKKIAQKQRLKIQLPTTALPKSYLFISVMSALAVNKMGEEENEDFFFNLKLGLSYA